MKKTEYLTAAELARKWNVKTQWIYELAKQGRIKSELFYGRWLFKTNTKRPEAIRSGPKPKT